MNQRKFLGMAGVGVEVTRGKRGSLLLSARKLNQLATRMIASYTFLDEVIEIRLQIEGGGNNGGIRLR